MNKQLEVVILLTVFSLCLSDNKTTDEIVGKLTQLSADQNDWNLPIDYFSSDNVTVIFVHTNFSEDTETTKNNISACDVTETEVHCNNINIFETVKILPPTTQFLDISESPVSTLREPIFQNLTHLVHLKLTNNSIRYITSKVFVGLEQLKKLNLSNNHIMALLRQVFRGCPGLEEIDLSRNRILTLNAIPIALGTLPNLTMVNFAYNHLGIIGSGNLFPLEQCSIESLDFSFCNISRAAYGSFRHLPKLKNLSLKVTYLDDQSLSDITSSLSNIRFLDLRLLPRITSFPSFAMSSLQNSTLEELNLSVNKLSVISNDSFGVMPNLKYLRLTSSSIFTISEGAFDGITSLERLDLSNNYLKEIPSAISVLKNLKMLYINKQEVDMFSKFVIPDNLLSNLTQLEAILMNNNKIDSVINGFAFRGLSKLRYLTLFQCGIYQISDNALSTLTSLEYLELSHNKIFSLSTKTLTGLKSLKILNLRGNGLILGMNQRPFIHTPLLEYVNLRQNKLSSLKSGLFSTLTNLTKIDLRQNKIKTWNHTIFARNGNLKELRASNNEIVFVTSAMIDDFEGVELLDLSYNPFDCANCNMERFQSWLIQSDLISLEDRAVYMCSLPTEFSGYSLFKELPFDHCWPVSFTLMLQLSIGFSIFFVALIIVLILVGKFKWYIRYWCFHMHSTIKRLSINAETTQYIFDAFVSYNSSDVAWVGSVLLPTLESYSSSLKLCIHDRDFEVGRLITENILEAIDKSKKVLLVLTDSFVKSEWCLFELHVAQHRLFHDTRDALVLVQVGDIDKNSLTKNLKYLMHTRTLLVWPENADQRKDFWNRLYKILNE